MKSVVGSSVTEDRNPSCALRGGSPETKSLGLRRHNSMDIVSKANILHPRVHYCVGFSLRVHFTTGAGKQVSDSFESLAVNFSLLSKYILMIEFVSFRRPVLEQPPEDLDPGEEDPGAA